MKLSEANIQTLIKLGVGVIGVIVAIIVITSAWFQTEAGFTYVYQNTLTGNIRVYTEPGVHFRLPGFARLEEYKQVMTVAFGGDEKTAALTRQLNPIGVRFADTYTGQIPATFRFKLSADAKKIIDMHKEFRSFNNLVDALIVKNSRNVTVITATQYTGEEFFQGGLNQFKAKLEDQLREGVYETERKQVEVEQTDLAPVGLEQDDSNKLQRTKQLVWKTVPILDASGQIRRQSNPLDQYGIQVTQVTVGDPIPEEQLNRLLMDKKLLVAERIKTIQEQETARAQAKTEQLKKEIERTRAVQDAQRSKELAVIAQTKEVDVAKQIALKEIVEQRKEKRPGGNRQGQGTRHCRGQSQHPKSQCRGGQVRGHGDSRNRHCPGRGAQGQVRRARGLQRHLSGGSAARHRHRAVHQPAQFHGGYAGQLRANWHRRWRV